MLGSALRVPVKNNDEDGILKTEERLMKKVIPKGHQVETYRKFHDAEYLRSIGMATQIQEQREKMLFWIVLKMVLNRELNKALNRELNKALNREKRR